MIMAQAQPATTQPRDTVFEALIASLQGAAAYNRDDVVPPAAILWTDERREWESLRPRLRVVLPQLLTLGAYDQADRRGPAIWLRYVLAGRIPDVSIPPDLVPIIYLPGASRPTLRATRGLSARAVIPGRMAISGRVLVAGQRQRLDDCGVLASRARRPWTGCGTGPRHGGVNTSGTGEIARRAGRRPQSQGCTRSARERGLRRAG